MGGLSLLLIIFTGLPAALLATLVLYGARDGASSRSFAYFAYSMAFWAFGLAGYLAVADYERLEAFRTIYYIAAATLIHGLFLFSHAFRKTAAMTKVTIISSLPTLLIVLMVAAIGVVGSVSDMGRFDVDIFYPEYVLYTIYFVSYAVLTFLNLYAVYDSEITHKRRFQFRSIIITIAVTLAAASTFDLFLPLFGVYTLIMVGPFFIVPVALIFFRLIMVHGLFSIRTAAVRTLAYVLSLIAMAAIYFGLAYIASITLFKGASTAAVSMSPINIILALILAFLFQPIRQFFDKVTNTIFFRDRYDTDEFLGRLGEILTSTTRLHQLLKNAAQEIETTIKASHVTFVVYRESGKEMAVGSDGLVGVKDEGREAVEQLLDVAPGTIVSVEEFSENGALHKATLRTLRGQHVTLVLRLGSVGYVTFGDHKSGGYTRRDERTLETVSDELEIAIQNARSIQEVRDLNTHLEQRIDSATKELRRSNEKLRKLDETKDEFLSMASHQLRTPLTGIKGYLSMVLDGDVGEINEQQKQLLTEAFAGSERMVRLIGDFLNVSRLQTGKFMLDRKSLDLSELVGEEVESIRSMATTRDMILHYKAPKRFPTLELDDDKIRQVVMNFIDNAIYYSRSPSTIVVKLFVEDDQAVFEVHDHGIGVPKEALEKLFTKFFRADNARRQRPDGTGVGLYLAKKVITEHHGELILESTEGKGSVFGFRLPIKK